MIFIGKDNAKSRKNKIISVFFAIFLYIICNFAPCKTWINEYSGIKYVICPYATGGGTCKSDGRQQVEKHLSRRAPCVFLCIALRESDHKVQNKNYVCHAGCWRGGISLSRPNTDSWRQTGALLPIFISQGCEIWSERLSKWNSAYRNFVWD